MQFNHQHGARTATTALQEALDNDVNRVDAAPAVVDAASASAFVADPEPGAPLFGRRTTSKGRTFHVDLLAGWSRA